MGLFISTGTRMKIQNEIRKKYKKAVDDVNLKYDSQDNKISESMVALISDIRQEDENLKDEEEEQPDRDLIDFSNLPTDFVRIDVEVNMPK